MTLKLLLAEDEQRLRDQLLDILERHGYAVDCAEDGARALTLGEEGQYDLAIIDLGLPKMSGMEVIERLRGQGKDYPMLILTARGDWQDKVEGLSAGADDYLVKPFHVQELLARVEALIRRASGAVTQDLTLGPVSLDCRAKSVSVNGDPVDLTAFEFNLLEYLMHRPGHVISKSELTEHLYHQDFDRDSNVIEVFVGRLRRKLDPENQISPIETVRGQGYRFGFR
ncbi:MAG: response regulator transcription factor [Gammaproteobacteria bacterium]|jgi:two-component system, OmpR family, response regulator PhoP|nr:response regulator transcription factor [Gammaproteobacteria bacterium]MBT4495113.1 response regulator transcription factor [Gammaproteobacteria bacterium]MBT7370517.1 response regulator transcription factor [Gammaproteobacteria bacterium]